MPSSVNKSGDLPLIPPSELMKRKPLGSTTPVNNNTSTNNKPIYKEDGFNRLGGSSGQLVSELSQFGVGALSGYKYQGNFVGASQNIGNAVLKGTFKEVVGSFRDNGKLLGVDAANAAGVGALLSGGVSVVSNTVSLLQGKESIRSAGADVVTDTMKGALSGVGGLAVGGVSALALTAFKVTGTPVVVASVIGGAIGASLINKLFHTEQIRQSLKGN
ncbi:MAG: hypothetical protein U0354_06175 [Candidatus Sericytochromatia bacterium]